MAVQTLVQLIFPVLFVMVPLPEKVEIVSANPGVTSADGLDVAPAPVLFVAVTVNVYFAAFVRPTTVHERTPLTEQV